MKLEIATMNASGTVTIPPKIRKQLKWKAGDKIFVHGYKDTILMKKIYTSK